jgi:hypothetical protein
MQRIKQSFEESMEDEEEEKKKKNRKDHNTAPALSLYQV